jgi:hypothetical protein
VNFLLPWSGVLLSFGLYKLFPTSFNTLFLINIWLFSLPHTFSTFTRSDRRSGTHITLVLGLMMVFALSVMGLANTSGMVVLYSLYFYWQQFHYGKQNYGLAHWETHQTNSFDQIFYLLIVGLCLMGLLNQGGQSFFGYMLYFPLSLKISKLVIFALVLAVTGVYCWLRPTQIKHALSHSLIFSFAYLYCEHFALGWLLLNVFHNLQYLKFMKQFEKQLSYLILPAVLTLTLYLVQFHVLEGFILFSIPMGLTLMMALNFSHYTLDALIWKKAVK